MDQKPGPKGGKAWRTIVERTIPEWQVFVRKPNGTSEHFTFGRRRQIVILAGMAVLAVWAGTATVMLARQPDQLAEKERRLEEMIAATRTAQHRLAASQKMVGDIAREVDSVHANLAVLAEQSNSLNKEGRGRAPVQVARTRVGGDPAWDEDGQPGGTEAKAAREQVRRLEASLDRLRLAYATAVSNTAAIADSRIADAQRALSKLGLDPERLVEREKHERGRGGPFVPLTNAVADVGLGNLLSRMEQWSGVKAVMQKLPLAEPLHQSYDINSGFGARNDPLNHRTGVHEGVDLGAPFGSPVYSTGEGMVVTAGPWDRYGLTVEIDHGDGVLTRYAHLSRIKVREGQRVTRSTVIGLLGNSGRSTGAHLHYEVRVADAPRDPLKFISAGYDAPKDR